MRGERGQTGAEYLGALLLISVIIAAVATSSAGATIADHSKTLVCRIAGGTCAEPTPTVTPAPTPGATATPGASPTPAPTPGGGNQGPPLGPGAQVDVLPFPGSVTVTCKADSRVKPEDCLPKGGPGVSVQTSGEVKIERTPTALDANGCPWQTLSVATTFKLSANAEAKGAKAGGSLQGYLGVSTKYALTVTPDDAEAIANGTKPPPNPVDPSTIAVGESIQLSEDFYAGINAKGSYRALQVEMGYDTGTRVSSGVSRISPTTVRVMVGDADFVKQALKLGIGYKDLSLSLGNTKDLADGKLHAIDIDISTPAGWDAYQAFLGSGRLPTSGTPGTSNPTTANTIVYTDVTELQGKVGGFTFGGRLGSSEGRLTQTTNPDGSVDTVGFARYNDRGIAVTRKTDAAGNPIGTPTRSLLLNDVDPSLVEGLYRATGQPVPADPGNSVRLDFTESQLNTLREMALNSLADRIGMNGKRPTTQELSDSIRANDGRFIFDGVEYGFTGLEANLAAAQTPDDMLLALYHGGFSAAGILNSLDSMLANYDGLQLPIIHQPSCG